MLKNSQEKEFFEMSNNSHHFPLNTVPLHHKVVFKKKKSGALIILTQ